MGYSAGVMQTKVAKPRSSPGPITAMALVDDLPAVRDAMQENDVVALEALSIGRMAATEAIADELRTRYPGIVAERGVAARYLLRAALQTMDRWEITTPTIRRVARGYLEGRRVADIATEVSVTREHVSRTLAPKALKFAAIIILRIAASPTLLEDVLG